MLLENRLTVPVPVAEAWTVLLDIERVAPCMPGAALTGVDGDAFTGTVKVKLGPVSLTFKGSGRFVERDEAARRVVLTASGADSRGGGTARATVTAVLEPAGDQTSVVVTTDLDITGKAAQFGRGLIGDVSGKLIGQFADCLAGKLAAAALPPAGPPALPPAEPAQPGSSAEPGSSDGPVASAGPVAAVGPDSPVEPAAPDSSASSSAAARAARVLEADDDVEPIDLLAVSGIGAAVRRVVPYVVTAAASFAVVLGIIWWIKRR